MNDNTVIESEAPGGSPRKHSMAQKVVKISPRLVASDRTTGADGSSLGASGRDRHYPTIEKAMHRDVMQIAPAGPIGDGITTR
jgi:hypothetical protein